MKLKILITPLMIAIAIYLAIWVAVPAYSGPTGIVVAGGKLQKAESKLAEITGKEQNASKLVGILNSSSEQQKVLLQYLPEKKMDEDIIANISSISSKTGTFLTSLSLLDSPADDITKYAAGAKTAPASIDPLNPEVVDDSMVTEESVATKDAIKNFEAAVVLSGNYEKIRNFMGEVSNLKRFNSISSMHIAKSAEAGSDLLQVNLVIKFNYFEKAGATGSISSDIFSKGEFVNIGAIEKIKNKTSLDILKVNVDSAGRTNPFSAS